MQVDSVRPLRPRRMGGAAMSASSASGRADLQRELDGLAIEERAFVRGFAVDMACGEAAGGALVAAILDHRASRGRRSARRFLELQREEEARHARVFAAI